MNRPIWFLNFCALTDWNDPACLYDMAFWSPRILRYLDDTHVRGNAAAESVCRVIRRLWIRYGDFSRLQKPWGVLSDIVAVDRRIRGLA